LPRLAKSAWMRPAAASVTIIACLNAMVALLPQLIR
jgi:hypothetical protein